MNTTFRLSTVWITFRVANKHCFKIYTTKRIDKTETTSDTFKFYRASVYSNVTLSKYIWNKKGLANVYETILDAWELIIHTSHGTHSLLMRMKIVPTAPIDTMIQINVLHKTGFEYRQMWSIGTSSALARNKTHLISLETHLVSFETSLARNETRLERRW